ncbi:MAG: GLUG motif-containing protein [Dehalococcoidia bacterium]
MKTIGVFLIVVALIGGMIGCAPGPIEIRDWYDLHAIRNDLRGSYILMNDLDSASAGYTELASLTANGGRGWEPIGTPDDGFTGRFNGQGYEIRDLFMNRPDEDYVGLFAHISWIRYIDNVGVVENVGLVNAEVSASAEVGTLVGHNAGIVNNSYSSGSVTGDSRVGGLVGWNQATLSNSYSNCSVTGSTRVGGLTGDNWYYRGTVSNSYSTGGVTGSTRVGGLVGINYYGSVTNSYSVGRVTGSSQVGGLVGYNKGTVSNSFWDIQTSGQATSDGGTVKTTIEMKSIATFSAAGWDIIAVAGPGTRNTAYTWNIVDGQTHPLLSWEL